MNQARMNRENYRGKNVNISPNEHEVVNDLKTKVDCQITCRHGIFTTEIYSIVLFRLPHCTRHLLVDT